MIPLKKKKERGGNSFANWNLQPWAKHVIASESTGQAKNIYANAKAAFRHDESWEGVILHDEFRHQTFVGRENVHGLPVGTQWRDSYDGVATEWLQRQGIYIAKSTVADAIQDVAAENGVNPLQDYLNGLQWDGESRIGRWLVEYCGADECEFTNAAGRLWMIGAVSRAMNPGGKFDNVLLLEGKQGVGKSTALQTLGGDFFTDDMPDLHNKDSKEAMRGAWIFELGELSAIRKQDSELIKGFLTRTTDRYRASYDRHTQEYPRTVAFCGTTNEDEYLRDTHNRRFWPVRVNGIDLERMKADRDQLWAEAVAAYKAGEQWHMPDDLIEHAEAAQASRRQIDMWEEYTMKYVTHTPKFLDGDDDPVWTIRPAPIKWMKTDHILNDIFRLPLKDRGDFQKSRISKILKANGWEKRDWPKKNCFRAPDWNGETEEP